LAANLSSVTVDGDQHGAKRRRRLKSILYLKKLQISRFFTLPPYDKA